MTTAQLKLIFLVGGGCIAAAISYIRIRHPYEQTRRHRSGGNFQAVPNEESFAKLTQRERRFVEFATVEYAGQIYMTPRDFLESVLEHEPTPCLRRKILSGDEIFHFHAAVPPVRWNTVNFFRQMSDRGIVSFAEYLFLLSVLTRPENGFRVAFNMFDTDGNQRVDQREFLVIRQLLGKALRERKANDDTRKTLKRLAPNGGSMEELVKNGDASESIATTMQIHFFGRKGLGSLQFSDFFQFMRNLQREVLQVEFDRYSKGSDFISDVDFAKLLLRYSHLKPQEYDSYLQRIRSLINHNKVSFEEFEQFCQVLHNLDDFIVAMRFFHSEKEVISKEEFSRAVKVCCGSVPNEHLIDVVFALFGADGDGLMSYSQFLLMMKNRLRVRFGFRSVGWKAFMRCYKHEVKHSSDVKGKGR